jgi:hypothetical protein
MDEPQGRIEFNEKAKKKITLQATYCKICHEDTRCGECAHIVAAGNNGPRNKRLLVSVGLITPDYDVGDYRNGIFLCANCHRKIDVFPEKYTYPYLKSIQELDEEDDHKNPIKDLHAKKIQCSVYIKEPETNITILQYGKYECTKCHKILSSQVNLDNHMVKNVCRREDRICPRCGKLFKRKDNCLHHLEKNVCDRIKTKIILKPVISVLQDQMIEKLTAELNIMRGKCEALRENPRTQNITLYPSTFGTDNMINVMKRIQTYERPVENIKSSSENIKSSSERIHIGKIIDQIIDDKRSIINQYVSDNGEQVGKKILAKYERFQDQPRDDSSFRRDLGIEICGLLLNMKSVIAKDEKTARLLDEVECSELDL